MNHPLRPVFYVAILLQLSLLLASCAQGRKPASSLAPSPLRYASNLTCERGEGYSLWTLRNPWDTTAVLHRYLLHPDTLSEPDLSTFQFAFSIIRTPVRSAGVATAVHCGLLDELGVADRIAGVCEKEYIDLPAVNEGLSAGRIADFGNGMNPNIERIMDVAPDVLLLTPFEHSGGYGRVERLGIPIIECAEYMEPTPLARAEWMRFYGMLYGQEQRADSLFQEVEQRYHEQQQLASQADGRPSVVLDKMAGSVWYVPGGRSTIGQMLSDAQCDYPWADNSDSGSLQLSFEAVLERAGHCQYWILRYDSRDTLTMNALLSERDGYRMMQAVADNQVYACNVSTSMFYEETPFRPDLLLQDFIHILHPDIPNLPPLRYYHKMRDER